ncbi:hypothetical protein [Kitasatospora sp. McL0602]|uniref:hypothetical protein n=1 Tax=Kitasatospora sp. McL0602 TaxID=3439530 RepID=UPI003F8A2EB1
MSWNGTTFDRELSQAFAAEGRRSEVTAAGVAARWRRFAEDCVAGYAWDLEDYLDDLTLRTTLAAVLPASAGPEADQLRAAVEQDDLMLHQVLNREVFPRQPADQWWLRNCPAYAARHFCAEFEQAYGVQIQPRSRFDADVAALVGLLTDGLTPAQACLEFRASGRYAAATDGLFLRAAREALTLDRRAARALWSWRTGKTTDAEFRAAFSEPDIRSAKTSMGTSMTFRFGISAAVGPVEHDPTTAFPILR